MVVIDPDDRDALRPLSSPLSARVALPERPDQGCRRQSPGRESAALFEEPATVAAGRPRWWHPSHPFFGTKARNRRGLSTVMRRIVSSFTPASRSFGTKTVSVLP